MGTETVSVSLPNGSSEELGLYLPRKLEDVVATRSENCAYVLPPEAHDLSPAECNAEDSSETEEIIYSSLPPDINIDIMMRATRTPSTGWKYKIKKLDGKLRIIRHEERHSPSQPRKVPCIACSRLIGATELFLNFPDDLDRRRLWGNALGFKYNEILRLRIATGYSITSIGHICTDHFSEECFRKYNFNKAAIECFGMPLTYSSNSPITPPKKRTPWDCTVCNYRCYSVSEMHVHLTAHAKLGKDDEKVRDALLDKGITCPFCRRCTYGYKTISGFQRHLLIEPTSHFYLKRIYEIAVKGCRSSCLEPVHEWSTWSENNVFYAYHGCEVPFSSPTKRGGSTSDSDISSLKKIKAGISKSAGDSDVRSAARRLNFANEEPSASAIKSKSNQTELKDDRAKIEMSTNYVTRIKALLSPEALIRVESNDDFIVDNTNNLAHALRIVSEEDYGPDELFSFDEDEFSPLIPSQMDRPHLLSKQRKTTRQLESNEARLRIFGDSDVPKGYKRIDGPNGPRLVPLQLLHRTMNLQHERKSWRERFAPDVKIRNRRFLPLN